MDERQMWNVVSSCTLTLTLTQTQTQYPFGSEWIISLSRLLFAASSFNVWLFALCAFARDRNMHFMWARKTYIFRLNHGPNEQDSQPRSKQRADNEKREREKTEMKQTATTNEENDSIFESKNVLCARASARALFQYEGYLPSIHHNTEHSVTHAHINQSTYMHIYEKQ